MRIQMVDAYEAKKKRIDREQKILDEKKVVDEEKIANAQNATNAQKEVETNFKKTVQLNCPDHILWEFREIMAASKLPGTAFINPHTKKTEKFPSDPNEFTAIHLQIIARNESQNTTGVMKTYLYQDEQGQEQLTSDQIARVRCLVKATTIAGVTLATAQGGYPAGVSTREVFKEPQKIIVVDQSGLQWQGDLRNTGGMFFYPDDTKDAPLPKGCASWKEYASFQKDMFKAMYGKDRPQVPSNNTMDVTWGGVKGCLDLNEVALAIENEFLQSLDAVVIQGNKDLNVDEKINFKFLKAGMGFFSKGLTDCNITNLEVARLEGIERALQRIANLPKEEQETALGKIKSLELPYSAAPPETDAIIERIEQLAQKLGLAWQGADKEDFFLPREGYVNATTNCGDPHAMIGNEGNYGSVDAAISTNSNVSHFNPVVNEGIQLRASPSIVNDNTISDKDAALNEIRMATVKYITWMNENAQGIRLTHLFHGNNGLERAQNILNMIDEGNTKNIDKALADAFAASGNSQHSYSRYLVQHLSPENKVLDNGTTDTEFAQTKDTYNVNEKFKAFKAQANQLKNEHIEKHKEKEVINTSEIPTMSSPRSS